MFSFYHLLALYTSLRVAFAAKECQSVANHNAVWGYAGAVGTQYPSTSTEADCAGMCKENLTCHYYTWHGPACITCTTGDWMFKCVMWTAAQAAQVGRTSPATWVVVSGVHSGTCAEGLNPLFPSDSPSTELMNAKQCKLPGGAVGWGHTGINYGVFPSADACGATVMSQTACPNKNMFLWMAGSTGGCYCFADPNQTPSSNDCVWMVSEFSTYKFVKGNTCTTTQRNFNAVWGYAGAVGTKWPTMKSADECRDSCQLDPTCSYWTYHGPECQSCTAGSQWMMKCVTWTVSQAAAVGRTSPASWVFALGVTSGICHKNGASRGSGGPGVHINVPYNPNGVAMHNPVNSLPQPTPMSGGTMGLPQTGSSVTHIHTGSPVFMPHSTPAPAPSTSTDWLSVVKALSVINILLVVGMAIFFTVCCVKQGMCCSSEDKEIEDEVPDQEQV